MITHACHHHTNDHHPGVMSYAFDLLKKNSATWGGYCLNFNFQINLSFWTLSPYRLIFWLGIRHACLDVVSIYIYNHLLKASTSLFLATTAPNSNPLVQQNNKLPIRYREIVQCTPYSHPRNQIILSPKSTNILPYLHQHFIILDKQPSLI